MSITEFCAVNRIAISDYYQAKAAGYGPVETSIDSIIVITSQAAAAWAVTRKAVETAVKAS